MWRVTRIYQVMRMCQEFQENFKETQITERENGLRSLKPIPIKLIEMRRHSYHLHPLNAAYRLERWVKRLLSWRICWSSYYQGNCRPNLTSGITYRRQSVVNKAALTCDKASVSAEAGEFHNSGVRSGMPLTYEPSDEPDNRGMHNKIIQFKCRKSNSQGIHVRWRQRGCLP